jgi:hypothetical protein
MSPYVVRFSYNITHLTTPIAQWTAKKYKRAYVAVNDFAPGHETETAFEKAYAGPGRDEDKMLAENRLHSVKTSAKTGEGVEDAFKWLAKSALEAGAARK